MSTTVISDILVSDNALDATTFGALLTHGSPPGYSEFLNFLTGDYQYTDAVYKMKVTSLDTNRGVLETLTLDVDVEDIIEKGSSTITVASTGIAVTYSNTFHTNPPELVTAFKSGTAVAIPEVTTQSITGFTVKLWDPVATAYITGAVTWAAHGY